MTKSRAVDLERLQGDVEWALERGLGPRDLVPMLERLRTHAPRGSSAACFAGTELAEVVLSREPWRAAVLAREVLRHEQTDRSWAVLGLALTLLGHYRSAKRAFAKALTLAPGCSSYAHNLGHLLDAALNRPREALPWLARARQALPADAEIAASYAHALLRVGRGEDATRVLEGALGCTQSLSRNACSVRAVRKIGEIAAGAALCERRSGRVALCRGPRGRAGGGRGGVLSARR